MGQWSTFRTLDHYPSTSNFTVITNGLSTFQGSETPLGYISKTECWTSPSAMFIFVKFNFTFSAGTPHPSINKLTEWRHYRKRRGDVLLKRGWDERAQRLHFKPRRLTVQLGSRDDISFSLVGISRNSNISQYVVLDSSGNGQQENMLIFKAP